MKIRYMLLFVHEQRLAILFSRRYINKFNGLIEVFFHNALDFVKSDMEELTPLVDKI